MTVTTLASYDCAPGDRDAVLEILEPARVATIAEEGCEYFIVLAPQDAPDRVVLIEGWRSPGHLAAHRETAHFAGIILERLVPRLARRAVAVCDEIARSVARPAA
ncbi:putative quinol monooxygenase [Microbacterium gilvum]|uniref:ABM domain-containing protein n=1 Tax=Microbacterium gilvum TaxID=1336204 RepID=A0ABP9A137_9MICO